MGKDRCILIGEFDRTSLESAYNDLRTVFRPTLWTPAEIRFLGETSPLTVLDVNDFLDLTYPVNTDALTEQAKAIASYVSLSIDNSVFHGHLSLGQVKSKVQNVEKMFRCLGERSAILLHDVTKENLLDYAYLAKSSALSVTSRFTDPSLDSVALGQSGELEGISFLQTLLGDNLSHVVQYGSSVNGSGKDIDLLVFVNEFTREAYSRLNDTCIDQLFGPKPVGVVLLPSSGLHAYAACDYNSLSVAHEGRLLYGDSLSFPVISDGESIRQMYIKAGKELTSLRSALTGGERLEAMCRSPGLLEHTLKLPIWIGKAITQQEEGTYLTKSEYVERVQPPSFEFSDSPSCSAVLDALYDANVWVSERITEHVERNYGC